MQPPTLFNKQTISNLIYYFIAVQIAIFIIYKFLLDSAFYKSYDKITNQLNVIGFNMDNHFFIEGKIMNIVSTMVPLLTTMVHY